MYKTLIISAFTAVVAIAAPVVHAGEAQSGRTADQTTVSAHRVDFQNAAQVERIYDRLVIAAHRVCDSQSGDVVIEAADKACAQEAVQDAVSQFNQPALYQVAARAAHNAPEQFAFNDRR